MDAEFKLTVMKNCEGTNPLITHERIRYNSDRCPLCVSLTQKLLDDKRIYNLEIALKTCLQKRSALQNKADLYRGHLMA